MSVARHGCDLLYCGYEDREGRHDALHLQVAWWQLLPYMHPLAVVKGSLSTGVFSPSALTRKTQALLGEFSAFTTGTVSPIGWKTYPSQDTGRQRETGNNDDKADGLAALDPYSSCGCAPRFCPTWSGLQESIRHFQQALLTPCLQVHYGLCIHTECAPPICRSVTNEAL